MNEYRKTISAIDRDDLNENHNHSVSLVLAEAKGVWKWSNRKKCLKVQICTTMPVFGWQALALNYNYELILEFVSTHVSRVL